MHRNLIVAGATGRVGSSFVTRLLNQQAQLGRGGLSVFLYATLSSTASSFSTDGVDQADSRPSRPWNRDWQGLISKISQESLGNPTLVDCTASPELSELYPRFLEAGISIVSANKLAWGSPLDAYEALYLAAARGQAHLGYETTVGSAVPMLAAVRSARLSGDEIVNITGVLSGTLSFVLSAVNDGRPFSEAVREARELGLTEPHPKEDLTGADVGRKLLILVREGGLRLEPGDIRVESLVPAHLEAEADAEAFLKGLESVDAEWSARAERARRSAKRLVYSAQMKPEPTAGVRAVSAETRLGSLDGVENALELHTIEAGDVPLFLSGRGAGPDVTAMGVLADVIQMATVAGGRT